MTKDDIIRMAVDAGIIPWTKHEYVGGKNFSASDEGLDGDLASLIQFAELVASAEREACAKWCETLNFIDGTGTAEAFADEVRNRGQE